jgi:hypothetical protein
VIAQATGITGILTAAGLGSSEIRHWFATPRRELRDLSPAAVLELGGATAGRLVLALAQADAIDIRATRLAGGDTTVRCAGCGATQLVFMVACLERGWPVCHGQTMQLADPPAGAHADRPAGRRFARQPARHTERSAT